MTQVNSQVDLGGFTRQAALPPPKRRRWLRILVPVLLLGGFAAVLASVMSDLFQGTAHVTVIRPRPVDAMPGATSGPAGGGGGTTTVVQAAGWIEPDPFPTQVTALAAGVVKDVLVQESDVVKAGDVVVRLVDADARLKFADADARLSRGRAELAKADADLTGAQASWDAALAVNEAAATARADVTARNAEHERRTAAVAQGVALKRIADEELTLQKWLVQEKAAGPRAVELATARAEEAAGALAVMQAEVALAAGEAAKSAAKLVRAEADLTLRIEDRQRLALAKAGRDLAGAALHESEAAQETAALRLERMNVRAPVGGVVLTRLVAPGHTLMNGESGAPVCTLYDPKHLRVRVDVPQGDVRKAVAGQHALVLAEARPGAPYHGTVLRVLQQADIQKVTLQVHVRIDDPDTAIRPEMLVQVQFLGGGAAGAGTGNGTGGMSGMPGMSGMAGGGGATVLVPARVLTGNTVWVVDPVTGNAALRTLTLGARSGDNVEVTAGLNVSDKVIDGGREGLKAGAKLMAHEGGFDAVH